MKTLTKLLLPKGISEFFHRYRRQYLEQNYFKQSFTHIKCGVYEIEVPKTHTLIELHNSQPYRNLCVGISAKYISAKYPDGTIIDIGANVGDTAAIIATYVQNKLILIEANDYFFDILVRNTSQLPNKIVTKKCLILDGSKVSGSFYYQKGNASFREKEDGKIQIKSERLSDVADENVCFIKIDTEGYDFKILKDSIDWLSSARSAVLFENRIRNSQDLDCSNELFARLMQIGYIYFIVWDDPGFHLVSTTSIDVLRDLNRYLFKVWQNDGHKSIYNYDVLCLNQNDEDVYKDICEWYRAY